MLVPYQWGWGREWLCYYWLGWAILGQAKIFEDLYGTQAESDLTKTKIPWVNDKQTNKLVATAHKNSSL